MRGLVRPRLAGDAVAGLVAVSVSVWLFFVAGDLPRSALVPIGPGFYPRLVLGATALAGAALVLRAFLVGGGAPAAAPAPNYRLVLVAFVLFGLYVTLLPLLGFRIATFLFVAAMQSAIEPPQTRRALLVVALVALGTTGVTYLVFERYLHVLLPRGTWTDF